jgi:hypothetical protein
MSYQADVAPRVRRCGQPQPPAPSRRSCSASVYGLGSAAPPRELGALPSDLRAHPSRRLATPLVQRSTTRRVML